MKDQTEMVQLPKAVTQTYTHIHSTLNMRHTLTHKKAAPAPPCTRHARVKQYKKAGSLRLRCILFRADLRFHVAHAPQEAQLWHPLGARLLAKRGLFPAPWTCSDVWSRAHSKQVGQGGAEILLN